MHRLLLLLVLSAATSEAAPLLSGFGGPAGFGTGVVTAGDDVSQQIDTTTAFQNGFRLGSTIYQYLWINTNGNVTFNAAYGLGRPSAFPLAVPMIAAYWGDADTRGVRTANDNTVYWHVETDRIVVTWHNVGFYRQHDTLRIDVQLVLTHTVSCGEDSYQAELRYNRCEWDVGDSTFFPDVGVCSSGDPDCVPAIAGFSADTTDYVQIPGSLTTSFRAQACNTSNIGEPGVWRFTTGHAPSTCVGDGERCDTGRMGACAVGIQRCIAAGPLCQAIGEVTPERCDGVDNDCNGTVDDGCPIDDACVRVTCGLGERCSGGACVDACEGITCPHGQTCVAGTCGTPCDGVTCGEDEVCVDGACELSCACGDCGDGEQCAASGLCAQTACSGIACDPGTYCDNGACVDACGGAVCPQGQECRTGACVEVPPPGVDAGVGSAGDDAGMDGTPSSGGCCDSGHGSPGGALLALGVALALRRRARRASLP